MIIQRELGKLIFYYYFFLGGGSQLGKKGTYISYTSIELGRSVASNYRKLRASLITYQLKPWRGVLIHSSLSSYSLTRLKLNVFLIHIHVDGHFTFIRGLVHTVFCCVYLDLDRFEDVHPTEIHFRWLTQQQHLRNKGVQINVSLIFYVNYSIDSCIL